ncbi:MAG: hypothetical protein PUF97_00680 [Bifidobacteriaceae bacterium]|nr:hypothetical protein [Bifidobacteriaceae bacterium]
MKNTSDKGRSTSDDATNERRIARILREMRGGPRADYERIEAETVERLHDELHSRRVTDGIVDTDTVWFTPVVDQWMRSIDVGEEMLTTDSVVRYAAANEETLALRDALLVSLLSEADRDSVLRMACEPHSADSVHTVYDALTAVFTESTAVPDLPRCAMGVQMHAHLLKALPRRYTAHVHASLAYLCWWMGFFSEARDSAEIALDINPSCTLADIILNALRFRIMPAWADFALGEIDDDNCGPCET